jgi:hypothetical protein
MIVQHRRRKLGEKASGRLKSFVCTERGVNAIKAIATGGDAFYGNATNSFQNSSYKTTRPGWIRSINIRAAVHVIADSNPQVPANCVAFATDIPLPSRQTDVYATGTFEALLNAINVDNGSYHA